ncbi:MAG TPA: glutamate racemase [Candidatus Saccharimonadales bacterium]|nr:glutamate racemase [Candidatus Saccharimonadales bacterium]
MKKIGVFDSGVGGRSVANAIQKALPDYEVIFVDDSKHLPYGSKAPEEIFGYVKPILDGLVKDGCEIIIIACNTVTTTLIDRLRSEFKIPLVGIEPMVKPAAELTKTGVIAVCATPTTLASQRYAWLKDNYAKHVKVLEPDCSDWTYMIQNNQVDHQKIAGRINEVLDAKADVIVLGCTHYHWIEDEIKEIAGDRAAVLQPEKPVIEQLKRALTQLS